MQRPRGCCGWTSRGRTRTWPRSCMRGSAPSLAAACPASSSPRASCTRCSRCGCATLCVHGNVSAQPRQVFRFCWWGFSNAAPATLQAPRLPPRHCPCRVLVDELPRGSGAVPSESAKSMCTLGTQRPTACSSGTAPTGACASRCSRCTRCRPRCSRRRGACRTSARASRRFRSAFAASSSPTRPRACASCCATAAARSSATRWASGRRCRCRPAPATLLELCQCCIPVV